MLQPLLFGRRGPNGRVPSIGGVDVQLHKVAEARSSGLNKLAQEDAPGPDDSEPCTKKTRQNPMRQASSTEQPEQANSKSEGGEPPRATGP